MIANSTDFRRALCLVIVGCLLLSATAEAATVINEVRPWSGNTGLPEDVWSEIELYNSGPADQDLSGFEMLTTISVALPNIVLPARCYLTVSFSAGSDDFDFTDSSGTYYADPAAGLNREAGEAGLYSGVPSAGTLVDFVNWGEQTSSFGAAYDHSQTAGQWVAGEFIDVWEHAAFSLIGRLPSGWDNNTLSNWQELPMPFAIPMRRHNPIQLDPPDATLDTVVTQLVWRNVPGHTVTQVEVDNDSTFTSPEFSTVLFGAATSVAVSLPDGFYYWRVRPNVGGSAPPAIWRFYQGLPTAIATSGSVALPQRFQHKDSRLLCIWNIATSRRGGCTEAAGAQGPWDAGHAQGAHIPNCNHCRNYCTRASIQMVNAKYGGSLTQDEISYHGYQNNVVGPEGDLGHGVGMWPQEDLAYSWAMNNAGIAENFLTPDGPIPWGTLTSEIDGGWPVLTVIRPPGWFHTVVFNGYLELPAILGGHRFIHITDPWPGRTNWYLWATMPCVRYYILPATPITGRATDPNVTLDGDGDGVVNFDEQHPDPASEQVARPFCSLWSDPDTEDDEVRDKQEIRSYTFHDIDHGHNNDALLFPDIDGDGLRQECDCDGDNDSDFDGGEDINGDGRNPIGGLETCEYDPAQLEINCGVFLVPGPVLCTEEAFLFGQTYHSVSWYPYELISPCPPPIDGMGLGWSGIVFSNFLGIIPPQSIGLFGPGIYRVIVDVLRDHLYSEPDNWDPWTCFGVPPHCYLIIKTPDLTYTQDWYLPVLDSLGLQYTITLTPPGMDIPTFPELQPYFVVILVTGDTPPGLCISPNDAVTLMQYLDSGGKLMITGDNIGTEAFQFPTPERQIFYTQYLGAMYNQEFPTCQVGATQPATFFQPPSTFQTRGVGGANYAQYMPDDVNLAAGTGSFAASRWAPFCPTTAGVNVVARENLPANSRSVYYAFPWENITSLATRQTMMDQTLDWLYGTTAPIPAVDNLTIKAELNSLQLNWTPVPDALGYEIHASQDPTFVPSDLTQLGYTVDSFFDIFYEVELPPLQFFSVVATGTGHGGGDGGGGVTSELRNWIGEQTDMNVVRERLDREKIKYRMVTSATK